MQQCNYASNCKKFNQGTCTGDFCIRKYKLDEAYKSSMLTSDQQKHIKLRIDADGTDREEFMRLKRIEDDIINFVTEHNNLMICSSTCGNGKTRWAIRLLQSYINKTWHCNTSTCPVLFVHVPRFLISLKKNISGVDDYALQIQKNILNSDIVVFDELSVKCLTEFEHDTLLDIIDNRLSNGKTNIYTSNILPNRLVEYIGERLYSRIINASTVIELKGADKRGLVE